MADDIELGRRQHRRFAIEIEAEVRTPGESFPAWTRDLSRGGICMVAAERIKAGSKFDLAIQLILGEESVSEPLVIPGTCVWCTEVPEGHQIGGAFTDLDEETAEYLQMFLNFLAKGVDVSGQEEEEEEDEVDDDKGLFG